MLYTEAERRLSVGGSTIRYRTNRKTLLTSEITTIKIYSDQEDGIYYVGEDAILKADLQNPSSAHFCTWHKEKDGKKDAINTIKYKSKYKEVTRRYGIGELLLTITQCDSLDEGTYTLVVSCKGVDICSNEIHLKVVTGPPKVTLDKIPWALLNENAELKATIRGYPNRYKVIWMKGNNYIDTNDPKYQGSTNKGNISALCIKNVEHDDVGEYTIIAENEIWQEGKSSAKLEVIGVSQMFFVSGPVVVSPSDTITFQLYLPIPTDSKINIKWWKIKDQPIQEIKCGIKKYLYVQKDNHMHIFEITNAETEDSATYYFSFGGKASNKISVHVDDSGECLTVGQNSLRLYALQNVGAEALRKVFEDLHVSFEVAIYELKQKLSKKSKNKWNNRNLLSRLDTKITLKDADISLMYQLLKNKIKENPRLGWGNPPGRDNNKTADDIERIHRSRNYICHKDASEIETTEFNDLVIDLISAINRLSKDNVKLIQNSCKILNKAFTAPEIIEMQKKLEITKKSENRWDQLFLNTELNGRSQGRESSSQYEKIRFHPVCSPGINIFENDTQAASKQMFRSDLCFMNYPMKIGKKVYLCGNHDIKTLMNYINFAYLRIGLTNINPYDLTTREANEIELAKVNCIQEQNGRIHFKFELGISLCSFVRCTLRIQTNREYEYTYQKASINHPLWLVIEPYGIKSIELKNNPN